MDFAETMNENPHQSPHDGAASRWFRPWRVLLLAAVSIVAVLGPIVWQAVREKIARDRARQNLEKLGQALEQYQARQRSQSPVSETPAKPAD